MLRRSSPTTTTSTTSSEDSSKKESHVQQHQQDPVYLTDCMPPIMSGFPFNRNSWHDSSPKSNAAEQPGGIRNVSRQDEVAEQQTPSPPQKSMTILRHGHSLKYSGGALHGNHQNPQEFDHNFVPPNAADNALESRETTRRYHGDSQSGPCRISSKIPPLVRVSTIEDDNTETLGNNIDLNNSSSERPQTPPNKVPFRQNDSLSRCHSLRSVSSRRTKDLRSSAIMRSASGSTIALNDEDDNDQDYDQQTTTASTGRLAKTPPGHPATLAVRRDSFNTVQGKSRSMTCLLAAAASAAEIAGQPVLVSHARTRSYLCGSVGPTSLLGTEELEKYFPDRNVRVFVCTWNMNGQTPPHYLADLLLPLNIEYVPDVLVIGTQESLAERTEWEVRLQETLGPSHVMFHSATLGTLHLSVFLRRDLIWFCSIPEVDSFSTRPGSQFKTKGAVALAFILFGTSFLFVNSHLTAHEENVKDRIKDLKKLNAMLNLPKTLPCRKSKKLQLTGSGDFSDNFDCVFWCGDLNFRLEQSREVVMREVEGGASVLDFDQLNYLKNEGFIFRGYSEDTIKFPPTYKYDPGTNQFDTSSKKRVPSYTDRILYKHQSSTEVRPLHYDSVQDVTTSDHKPVWGMWEVKVRPGKDNVPLSGGLFNRDVYLVGLKRRSEALHPPSSGKMNCSIQ